MTPYANHIQEYHHKITTGEIVVGKWIKALYDKITAGLRDGLFFFDAKTAQRAIDFVEAFCHHCEGRSDLIKLELWQRAAVSVIFGIVGEDGLRVFREVFMVIGRKNGKSIFASAIIAYVKYLDGEYGAKIYCLAPKLEQASIVFENFHRMVMQEPELAALVVKRRSDIYMESTNSVTKPLAFNAKKSDGFNPHLTVCDEIASWPAEQGRKGGQTQRPPQTKRHPRVLPHRHQAQHKTQHRGDHHPDDKSVHSAPRLTHEQRGQRQLHHIAHQRDPRRRAGMVGGVQSPAQHPLKTAAGGGYGQGQQVATRGPFSIEQHP